MYLSLARLAYPIDALIHPPPAAAAVSTATGSLSLSFLLVGGPFNPPNRNDKFSATLCRSVRMNKLWKTTLFESELTPITLISECAEALSIIISHCTGHYCSVLSIIFGKSILPSSILASPKQSLLQKTTYLQWRGIVIAIRFIV